jgi:MFS family permease
MVAILPLLAANEFASDEPVAMSVIYGAFGVGGVIGAATGSRALERFGLGRVFIVGLAIWGAGFAASTFLQERIPVLIVFSLAGFGLPWVQIAFSTLRQKVTPEPMLGRVMAGTRAVVNAAYPIGAVGLTAVAALVGSLTTSRVVSLSLIGVALVLGVGTLGQVGPNPTPMNEAAAPDGTAAS